MKKVPRPPPTDAEGQARWQEDFTRLREASPSRWGRWIRPRIVFVHPWLARLYGGVFMWAGWVVVGRDMLTAPYYARQFILSQLWGRVRHGQPFAAIGIFLCTGAMTLLVQVSGSNLLSLMIGSGALALMVWANLPKRDYEGDDAASAVLGRRAVKAGIIWVVSKRMDKLTPGDRERLKRMGWEVTSERADTPDGAQEGPPASDVDERSDDKALLVSR